MKVKDIKTALAAQGKKVSTRQVQTYIKACRIQHLGVRQRPQNYPEDSAEIIARHLGLNGQRRAA